jgi:hypothetical protein
LIAKLRVVSRPRTSWVFHSGTLGATGQHFRFGLPLPPCHRLVLAGALPGERTEKRSRMVEISRLSAAPLDGEEQTVRGEESIDPGKVRE